MPLKREGIVVAKSDVDIGIQVKRMIETLVAQRGVSRKRRSSLDAKLMTVMNNDKEPRNDVEHQPQTPPRAVDSDASQMHQKPRPTMPAGLNQVDCKSGVHVEELRAPMHPLQSLRTLNPIRTRVFNVTSKCDSLLIPFCVRVN